MAFLKCWSLTSHPSDTLQTIGVFRVSEHCEYLGPCQVLNRDVQNGTEAIGLREMLQYFLWDITQTKYCSPLTEISSKLLWGEIQGSESDCPISGWARLFNSFQFFQLCPSHFLPPPFVPSSLFFSSLITLSLCFTVFYIVAGVQMRKKQDLFHCISHLRIALYVYVDETEMGIKLSVVCFML